MAKYSLQVLLKCVDLGVATYHPIILEQGAIFMNSTTDNAEKQQAKAKLQEACAGYRDLFNEILSALDAPQTTPEAPRVTAYGIEDPETDNAMAELANHLELLNAFPFAIENIIDTVGTPELIERNIYRLAGALSILLEQTENKRLVLEEILQKGEK